MIFFVELFFLEVDENASDGSTEYASSSSSGMRFGSLYTHIAVFLSGLTEHEEVMSGSDCMSCLCQFWQIYIIYFLGSVRSPVRPEDGIVSPPPGMFLFYDFFFLYVFFS